LSEKFWGFKRKGGVFYEKRAINIPKLFLRGVKGKKDNGFMGGD
jgi:hypothetical protein